MNDPLTIYSDLVKIGEGASGSVFSAVENVLFSTYCRFMFSYSLLNCFLLSCFCIQASGHRVAIKQMQLSRQPKPDVLINEILLMKRSFPILLLDTFTSQLSLLVGLQLSTSSYRRVLRQFSGF